MWNQLPNAAKLIIVFGSVIGIGKGVERFIKKKVFVSFAIEDKKSRDLLVGQSRNDRTPFEFTDMSVKKPWSRAWKTRCRKRIKSCSGVIVLISKSTFQADGALWEIRCAAEERIPTRALYINNESRGCTLPAELKGQHIYKWSWENIKKFVEKLN